MARGKTKLKAVERTPKPAAKPARSEAKPSHKRGWGETFSWLACATAHIMGRPVAFLTATALVIVWACTGPIFHYSDTWQLVINTSTTIVTFLMVFLIQNTQNRDTMALQLKLSELILCLNEAEDRFAGAEDLSEKELEDLHEELRERADKTLGALNSRRAQDKKAS